MENEFNSKKEWEWVSDFVDSFLFNHIVGTVDYVWYMV